MRFTCVLLGAFVASSVAACGAPQPKRGEVQREWSRTLRELGINPVYPPREDLQVGDVYVRRGYVDDQKLVPTSGFAPIDLWLATAKTGEGLAAFYAARASFPLTPKEKPAGAVPASVTAEKSIFEVGDNMRMRLVAFPDFASMNVRNFDLRALIPVEALGLGLGGNWNGQHQANVKVPLAESCGLPLAEALPLVADRNADTWTLKKEIADSTLLEKLLADVHAWGASASGLTPEQRDAIAKDTWVHLDLITEVFYTRAIEVAVSSQTSGGARATVRPLAGGAAPDDAAPLAGQGDALARANKLNDELKKIDAQQVPGGSVQFLSASDQSLSMQRRFDRPIAIGFRAVQLTVDPATAAITGIGAASERAGVVTSGAETAAVEATLERMQQELEGAGIKGYKLTLERAADRLRIFYRVTGAAEGTPDELKDVILGKAAQIATDVRATQAWDEAANELFERLAGGPIEVEPEEE